MNISIMQYSKLISGMKPEQILKLTNSYFGHIGPIIRKYGFVQNHTSDGIVALYKSQKKALSASVELQLATSAYNMNVASKNDLPFIDVGISVQSGTVLAAIVGENERMECTIISSHQKSSAKLDFLLRKLNLKMVTTTLGSESLKKSVANHTAFRMLGCIEVETSTGMSVARVYEVLKKSDDIKIQLNHEFHRAITMFEEGNYDEALPIFSTIVSEIPDDTVSKLYLERCSKNLNQVKMIYNNLSVSDVLKDDALFHGFETFCQKEFSTENVVLWSEIENYKIQPETNRRSIAKRLRKEYLSLSGRKTININQALKEKVSNSILAPTSEILSENLFVDVQREIELVMSDTCNRFKGSHLFIESIAKSIYAIHPPYLDQL